MYCWYDFKPLPNNVIRLLLARMGFALEISKLNIVQKNYLKGLIPEQEPETTTSSTKIYKNAEFRTLC